MRIGKLLGFAGVAVAASIATGRLVGSAPRDEPGDASAIIIVSPGAPRGTVELSSFGVAGLATESNHAFAALHVRAIVTNWSDPVPWTLDAGDARIEDAIAPILLNSNVATVPVAIVAHGERVEIDLYFPLPSEELSGFVVAIPLVANGRTVVSRARFVAEARLAPFTAELEVLGAGRWWWSASTFAWPSFYHVDGIVTPRPPRSAVVMRVPRFRFVTR